MKLNIGQVEDLARRVEQSRRDKGLTHDEIARSLALNQSQVSRVCAGNFASVNETVMRICIFLDVPLLGWTFPVDSDEYRLTAGILGIWNRTPEDAKRLLRLLQSVGEIRRGT